MKSIQERINELEIELSNSTFYEPVLFALMIAGFIVYACVVSYFVLENYTTAKIVLYAGLNCIWLSFVEVVCLFSIATYRAEIKELALLRSRVK